MAVGEGRGIEFGGLAGFAIIEPQARRHRALAHRLSPHLPGATAPKRTPWVSLATMMRSPPGSSIGPAWTVPPCLPTLSAATSTLSEERRGGKECVSMGRSRWVPEHKKKKKEKY